MIDHSWISPRYATGGGLETRDDVDQIKAAGITAILDCRIEFDDAQLLTTGEPRLLSPNYGSMLFRWSPGFDYLWCPTADDGLPKPNEWFQQGIKFAFETLAHPKAKLLCHCAAGVNRGPSMLYAIMRAFGFGAAAARGNIAVNRPKALVRYADDADRAIRELGYE